jgi:hypothetical protein
MVFAHFLLKGCGDLQDLLCVEIARPDVFVNDRAREVHASVEAVYALEVASFLVYESAFISFLITFRSCRTSSKSMLRHVANLPKE